MGTIKRNAKKWQARLKRDFNVDPEDFKQMFGMGKGDYMPALSLFAVPAVDLNITRRHSVRRKPIRAARVAVGRGRRGQL